MNEPLPVFVDPADLRALVRSLRHRAQFIEQASSCAGCPLGGVPYALREAAADVEKLTKGEPVEGLDFFK